MADNVGFEALIVGDEICPGIDEMALLSLADGAEVSVNGELRARRLTGDAATDPIASLAALYAHAAERGQTLKANDIVSTGAMCQPFDLVGSGYEVSVKYLGKQLSFTL
ncbi:hypothetical protein D3C79_976060 [compost metagenome]